MKKYDVVIVGGGVVGLTTALAIASQSSLNVAIIEAKPLTKSMRVSAISLSSRTILRNLGCWEFIKFSPYHKMTVWEQAGEIHFEDANVLGYIIEDAVLREGLMQRITHFPSITLLSPYQLTAINKKNNHIELINDEEILQTSLLIGADGANSWVRETLQIPLKNSDYEQKALVATIETELPHQKTAWQRFLPGGPLAFLPLENPHQCSIVWSAKHSVADTLLKEEDEVFRRKLGEAFQYKLGKITAVSARMHFPLRMRHVVNYVQEGVALVGDAAHTIHPLAGYGMNLGLLDGVTLAEVIVTAAAKGRGFGSFHTLRKYERSRKNETFTMMMVVNGLNQLFLSDNAMIQSLRNQGLNVTDKMQWLKKIMTSYALGKRSELPRLARGFEG